MKQYVDLLQKIIDNGEERKDRTGVGTRSIFGGRVEFDLRERFPLVTIKKTYWMKAFIEMLWFISGDTNVKTLQDQDVHIWNEWADDDGELGPVYGYQWRYWPGKITHHESDPNWYGDTHKYITQDPPIDQMKNLIDGLKNNPGSRRHIVTAWNPTDVDIMGLPPCHRDFQCYVSNDGHLDLMLAQRSWDVGLGAPFNIAQYALLTHLLARAVNLKPRMLSVNYGDAHIYSNHLDKLKERIETQSPIDCKTKLVITTDNTDIDKYKIHDFGIVNYMSHSHLKLDVAV